MEAYRLLHQLWLKTMFIVFIKTQGFQTVNILSPLQTKYILFFTWWYYSKKWWIDWFIIFYYNTNFLVTPSCAMLLVNCYVFWNCKIAFWSPGLTIYEMAEQEVGVMIRFDISRRKISPKRLCEYSVVGNMIG